MSATPQGVEAQQTMVDITTNNYQKAVENFFSLYCSYALTTYFAELAGTGKVIPSADVRKQLIGAGVPVEEFDEETGELDIDMKDMAIVYHVRCVPGSLTELEDEKQLRILQEIFVPLSQAMPALAATGDEAMLKNAAMTMQYILGKTIELSGSAHARDIKAAFDDGVTPQLQAYDEKFSRVEESIGGLGETLAADTGALAQRVVELGDAVSQLTQANALLLEKLGITGPASGSQGASDGAPVVPISAA